MNAICPKCQARHHIFRSVDDGYIDVARCTACGPAKTHQGLVITNADQVDYNKRRGRRRASKAEPLGPEKELTASELPKMLRLKRTGRNAP